MPIWTIQLESSPPFERPHQQGFIVCVQVDDESVENVPARFWRRDFQGMNWMQDPPVHEVRTGPSSDLPAAVAASILNPLRSVRLPIAVAGDFGYIHPTQFRLLIQSAWISCKIEWVDQLPSEWTEIEEPVRVLVALGEGRNDGDA